MEDLWDPMVRAMKSEGRLQEVFFCSTSDEDLDLGVVGEVRDPAVIPAVSQECLLELGAGVVGRVVGGCLNGCKGVKIICSFCPWILRSSKVTKEADVRKLRGSIGLWVASQDCKPKPRHSLAR